MYPCVFPCNTTAKDRKDMEKEQACWYLKENRAGIGEKWGGLFFLTFPNQCCKGFCELFVSAGIWVDLVALE